MFQYLDHHGPTRRSSCICASPAYIADSTPITKPQDIQAHRILQYGSTKRPKWTFTSSRGKDSVVALTSSLNSHDGGFLIAAAERGLGIVRVPDFLAQTSLDAGQLVQILQDYVPRPEGIYFVYPEARHLPQRTRVLMDFLRDRFKNN